MARRGSLVGDAYVRIHADSSAVDRELRREMKRAGSDAGDEFIDNFADNVDDAAKAKLRKANEAILNGVVGGKPEWDRQFKQSGIASIDEFTKVVSARMDRLGKKMKGKNLDELKKGLDGLKDWAGAAKIAEQSKKLEKAILDQDKAWQTYRVNVGRVLGDEASIGHWKKMQKAIKDQEKALASYDSNVRFSAKKVEKAVLDQDKAWQTYAENLEHHLDFKANNAIRRHLRTIKGFATADRDVVYGYSKMNRAVDRFEDSFRGSGARISHIIGRAFGKDSRNNFLNFTGSLAQGGARIAGAFASIPFKAVSSGFKLVNFSGGLAFKTLSGIGQLMDGGGKGGLLDAFNMLKQGVGNLGTSLGASLGAFVKGGLPGLIAIAAAIVGIAVAIPPLLSIVGSLAGALTALAGSISIGLAGGLLALGPVLLAAAGGIAVLIGLIVNLNSVGGDTKNKALKPLKEFTREWSKLMKFFEGKPTLNFANALGEIAPLIKTLKPFIKGLSDSIYDITLRFATLFTAKDMQPFIKAFQTSIPKIFTDLGLGVDNLIAALVKFFKPILPFAEKLAHNFERLMSQFLDWTGSAKGQNAIADFMENAWEKAQDVWDIIVLIGEAIGGLFSAGDSAAGGDFLEGIKTGLQTFVDWINSPDGAQALKEWFDNSKGFMEDLVAGIGNVVDALKTINWQEAADRANTAITWITNAMGWIVEAIAVVNFWITNMGLRWTAVVDVFVGIYNSTLGPMLSLILGAFSGIVRFIADMLDALSNVPGFEWAKTAATNLRGAADQADRVGDAVRRIPQSWEVTIRVGVSNATQGLLDGVNAIGRSAIFGASGGILTGPTLVRRNVVGGEAGDEALVPLRRPLSLVDPSVRALSAFAQGLPMTNAGSGGILGGGGRSIVIEDGAIRVSAPNSDPALVASSLIDRLAALAVR